jgi:hypothetical protein
LRFDQFTHLGTSSWATFKVRCNDGGGELVNRRSGNLVVGNIIFYCDGDVPQSTNRRHHVFLGSGHQQIE